MFLEGIGRSELDSGPDGRVRRFFDFRDQRHETSMQKLENGGVSTVECQQLFVCKRVGDRNRTSVQMTIASFELVAYPTPPDTLASTSDSFHTARLVDMKQTSSPPRPNYEAAAHDDLKDTQDTPYQQRINPELATPGAINPQTLNPRPARTFRPRSFHQHQVVPPRTVRLLPHTRRGALQPVI